MAEFLWKQEDGLMFATHGKFLVEVHPFKDEWHWKVYAGLTLLDTGHGDTLEDTIAVSLEKFNQVILAPR